jgi:hypothetical protein
MPQPRARQAASGSLSQLQVPGRCIGKQQHGRRVSQHQPAAGRVSAQGVVLLHCGCLQLPQLESTTLNLQEEAPCCYPDRHMHAMLCWAYLSLEAGQLSAFSCADDSSVLWSEPATFSAVVLCCAVLACLCRLARLSTISIKMDDGGIVTLTLCWPRCTCVQHAYTA